MILQGGRDELLVPVPRRTFQHGDYYMALDEIITGKLKTI